MDYGASTLSGDIRDRLLDEIVRHGPLSSAWVKLSALDQTRVIDGARAVSSMVLLNAIEVVASVDFPTIEVRLGKWTADPDPERGGLVITVRSPLVSDGHALLDHANGRAVLMLIDPSQFYGERAPALPMADQPELGLEGEEDHAQEAGLSASQLLALSPAALAELDAGVASDLREIIDGETGELSIGDNTTSPYAEAELRHREAEAARDRAFENAQPEPGEIVGVIQSVNMKTGEVVLAQPAGVGYVEANRYVGTPVEGYVVRRVKLFGRDEPEWANVPAADPPSGSGYELCPDGVVRIMPRRTKRREKGE
jgi:hypothetical protein